MVASHRPNVFRRLLIGSSLAAVASVLGAAPAEAQLARLRAAAGTPTALTAPTVVVPVRPATMREAAARQAALQSRAEQIRGYVTSARDAALAATRAKPTDGLSAGGLDPIAAVREAAALRALGGEANLARAAELMASVGATRDETGLVVWQGASAPVQETVNGRQQVTITQSDSRALLSWNRFDVGANTTLVFDQKQGGVAQTGWTVVNRVVTSVDPTTILGQVKADGTVLVLNRNGVIFGQGAQVNLHSLVASSLDIGNYGRDFRNIQLPDNQVVNVFESLTTKDRNTEYLLNGLFAGASSSSTLPPLLLSPLYAAGIQRSDSVPALEGVVAVDPGAQITAGTGGFLILSGPSVENRGILRASEGQVSLQGGRLIAATRSTGAATGVDADVRGLVLRTVGTVISGTERRSSAATPLDPIADDGSVLNAGLIESTRGYLSLGAGLFGNVTNDGLLAATTSVSRNGKISLTAGTVTLGGDADAGRASGIVITPDTNGEVIPQGTADAPAAFKTSVVEIGARADNGSAATSGVGIFIPALVSFEENALLYAPSATVTVGRGASVAFDPTAPINTLSGIRIATGAVLDVSGVKDVQLAAARNSLQITPVKRNELRDTPNYREVSLTGDFTLNGATLYVDPRRTGVRADGVRWIGSPLIEAGSLASQIGVTAAELMTRGGTISLGVNLISNARDVGATPQIAIARGATIDVSGGWVHYSEGIVRTSRLITADGRVVDIGDADPNDIFVGVADGFTEYQPRFGESENNASVPLDGGRFEAAYDEGRDAGALVIGGSSITIDGTIYGHGFAGVRQIGQGVRPGVTATIAQDQRLLQRNTTDLPSGAYVRIGALTGAAGVALGGDIAVVAPTDTGVPTDGTVTRLDATMLSGAGLSQLSLQTSGAVRFRQGSALTLADGGLLRVDAGRGIDFDGSVRIAGGTITARTYELARAPIAPDSITALGSAFTAADDLGPLYATAADLPNAPFDINVRGTLSTAGRWVNDFLSANPLGGAWIDGGSISLTVAPKVFVAIGESVASATEAGDLSGRITVAGGARLDVSAGGHIGADRTIDLDARGGSIALVNETTYASTTLTVPPLNETAGRSDAPIAGSNQSVDFTPDASVVPALVPAVQRAGVFFEEASLAAFGFTGSGTFTLVAPRIGFGADRADGANLSLDFFRTTGFGTLSATAFASRTIYDLFSNERAGYSAFFETTRFRVGAGETLDLTQSSLPRFLSRAQAGGLLSLATDSSYLGVIQPGVPATPFDRIAANLVLGGLTELQVAEGGAIVGAAEAAITAPKILNEGYIRLPGGSLTQRERLPVNLANLGIGVADFGEVFGAVDADGRYDEDAENAAGFVDPLDAERLLTNRELLARADAERFVYFRAALGGDEGIRFGGASVTDLSGVALIDQRAPYLPSGVQLLTGRVVAGGSITTAATFNPPTNDASQALFSTSIYGSPRYLNAADNTLPAIVGVTGARQIGAEAGAVVSIAGASGVFDELVTPTSYGRALDWSNGGSISVGGGGSLANIAIDARGGAARATGGTLNWGRPTFVQSDDGLAAPGIVSADQIMAAGFATVNALGSATFDGPVSLTLARAFTLGSIASTTGIAIDNEAAVRLSATAGTDAVVTAPFMRFASRLGTIPAVGEASEAPDARLTFRAGAGIDMIGGLLIDSTISSVRFVTPGDVRFIGVDDRRANSTDLPSLNGRLVAWGDLEFDAGRVYATTGTGNLQRFLEDRRNGEATTVQPYLLAALGTSAIRFGGTYRDTTTPLSAGSYLSIRASEIVQDGYLAAPLGLLEIGSNDRLAFGPAGPFVEPTTKLTFGAGSVTTVSGAGGLFPYGTTTDLTEYFFAPSVGLPITATPVGQLNLSGGTITIAEGSRLDGRGGGDVFAFEFVSGTGGSRDVLDRFNRDVFSSNGYDPLTGTGFQFADGRQVYAILPADQARSIALFDPIYSADYQSAAGGDLYGANVGRSITLDAAPGVAAGEYVLLPAHYALLPGALRVVENVGGAALAPGGGQVLLDGSILVGGYYSTAGTDLAESARRSFTVQSRDTFLSFSRIETTSGSASVVRQAAAAGEARPRLPIDAARVVLAPRIALDVAGAFDTTAATGGRGGEFDITAGAILIAGTAPARPPRNTLVLTDDTLARLNAASLVIGAERIENTDGTTGLGVIARSITVAGDVDLTVPELVLAVGGSRSALTVEGGARLTAAGTLSDPTSADYVIPSLEEPPFGYRFDASGIGASLRLAVGPERVIVRDGAAAAENSTRPAALTIGAATLTGATLSLESSRDFRIGDNAVLATPLIALSGDALRFGERGIGMPLLERLAAADRLTLRSSGTITFDAGRYQFNDLVLDAAAIGLTRGGRGSVLIDGGTVTLANSADDLGACRGSLSFACGRANSRLSIAGDTLVFGSGTIRTYGFAGGVALTGRDSAYVEGEGVLDVGGAALSLAAPFLADRAAAADPREQAVRPDYTFQTSAAMTVTGVTGASATPTGNAAPGARIAFGSADAPLAALTITDTDVRATAGIIDARATGDVTLAGSASLETPGYTRTFGDAVDSVTVSAGAGAVTLVSLTGDMTLGTSTSLIVDSGVGRAGVLTLAASNGAIALGAALNTGVTGAREASFVFDAGRSAFDLDGFARAYAARFGGDVAIRSGRGALTLSAGNGWRARSIALTADGGAITIGGTLDTSGTDIAGLSAADAAAARIDGGDIALWGRSGVTIAATARLDTHTHGYAATDTRVASAGDIAIGIADENAAIDLAEGAVIDAAARRAGNRLVAQTVKDPFSLADTIVYRFAEADRGGLVTLRAPVIRGGRAVDVRLGASIAAGEIEIEGVRRFDLDAIADSGLYSGVTRNAQGAIVLDFAATRQSTGLRNILTEDFTRGATQSLVAFIQSFDIAAADGSDLTGIRLRPGVELSSTGDVTFASNWNLGAGTLDIAGALADRLLVTVPELGTRADGTPYYAVRAGREAELFERHVTMLYRVGGRVDGEAPIVTLRARGALDITRSITDGFFSFRDKTDPDYMSYQLGGGDRTVNPAVQFGCGSAASGDCTQVGSFTDIIRGNVELSRDTIATISLGTPVAGSDLMPGTLAPYSALANSAAALGSGARGAGDPLGSAEAFPLLADGTRAVRSTTLRLVGGADRVASADPLHVDRATGASLAISGERSYTIVAEEGRGTFAGDLQIRLRPSPFTGDTQYVTAAPSDFIAAVADSSNTEGLDPELAGDYYTVLDWGQTGAIATTTRNRAIAFFEANFPRARFQGDSPATSTGVAAPLSVVIRFLQAYGDEYAAKIADGTFAAPRPELPRPATVAGSTAYVGTVVRTGDGSISVAAADAVDLRRTPEVVYRNELGGTGSVPPGVPADPVVYQVGGSAIYTAGHRLLQQTTAAATADGTVTLRFTPTGASAAPAVDDRNYVPSPKGQFLNAPVALTGGGDVTVSAVNDVIGRRDAWAEQYLATPTLIGRRTLGRPAFTLYESAAVPDGLVGASDQVWRVGRVGQATEIGIVAGNFTSGIATLGGGDATVTAGGAITDLTLALDTSVTTANPALPAGSDSGAAFAARQGRADAPPVLMTFGGGNALVSAGGDLIGGQIDVAMGQGRIIVGGDVVDAGGTGRPARGETFAGTLNALRLRVTDATITLDAAGSAFIGGIGALGVRSSSDPLIQDAGKGFFTANAGVSIAANGLVTLDASRPELAVTNFSSLFQDATGFVLPPSLSLVSIGEDVAFGGDVPRFLFPSVTGQLNLLAGGEIRSLALVMSDSDPSLLPGAFSARFAPGGIGGGLDFGFNGVFPSTTDAELRLYHNERPTHAADAEPARIYAAESIVGVTLSLPKQARIGAGEDIVDMVYFGQNVRDSDVTRITAGRDIIGTTRFSASQRRPYINGNSFTLGGYGAFSIEAGRNLGPFLNSATVAGGDNPGSYAGGIRTVGNDLNPWLENRGASITALFGIAAGVDYDALQATYLDPANLAQLDGDLFVQVSDESGNLSPDRTRPIYAPILARWLKVRAPAAYAAIFGTADDTAVAAQSYGRMGDLYAAFSALDNLTRRGFLLDQLYFNELAETSRPDGPSFQQYIRGYRATQTLFPTRLGYTDQLATYQTDPATIDADHPLGQPTKILVDGEPLAATRIQTGDVDLRLATIETTRGGDITILGPGGNVLAGSVVRTSDQAQRRATLFGIPEQAALENGFLGRANQLPIDAIPIGFEGVLTLRGGQIRSATDGDFRLNQSRLFTLAGGDITMWSSNGDLNAGQGPRSASAFPPVTVRFDQNGRSEVDSAGSVSGAGIGAFKQLPSDPSSTIILVAPVGEVDAGDAGVRASGNVFVAAARVANADNFSADGTLSGVPSSSVVASAAVPTDAASAIVGQVARLAGSSAGNADRRSLISVDVLGFVGESDPCRDGGPDNPDCPRP